MSDKLFVIIHNIIIIGGIAFLYSLTQSAWSFLLILAVLMIGKDKKDD